MARINSREDAFHVLYSNCVMDEETGCWEWTGSIDRNGYGNLEWKAKDARLNKAHRVAYGAFYGQPGELHVLHRCDNRICCNVAHMFLGTNADNVQDKVAKDRHSKGATHGRSKLTEEDVLEIRKMYADGYTRKEIAYVFDEVTYSTIKDIVNRTYWTHL